MAISTFKCDDQRDKAMQKQRDDFAAQRGRGADVLKEKISWVGKDGVHRKNPTSSNDAPRVTQIYAR